MNNRSTGNFGEELACKFLQKQGYKILERNFRIRGGELDIVAKDKNGDIVFVEVKARNTHEYGDPAESISPWKIRFLIRAVQFYLLKNNLIDKPYRIDAIIIDFLEGTK